MRHRITMVITEMCNMGCKYCYVPHEKVPDTIMSNDIIKQSIRYAESRLKDGDELSIELFGGEALIAWDAVQYCIKEAAGLSNRLKNRFNVTLFTNVTLLTEDKLRWLKEYSFVHFNFSLDGSRECHNSSRIYLNGDGTYDDVIKNYSTYQRIYKDKRPIEEVSMFTISPSNIDYFLSVIDDYKNRGIKTFHVCIARDDVWSDIDIKKYKEVIDKATDVYIEEFPKSGLMNIYMLYPVLDNMMKRESICCASRDLVGISPTGDIYACQRFFNHRDKDYRIGNVWDGIDKYNINYTTLNKLRSRHLNECVNCKYGLFPGCMSQCLASCLEFNGTIFKPIDSICQIHKINYDASVRIHHALKDNANYKTLIQGIVNRQGG